MAQTATTPAAQTAGRALSPLDQMRGQVLSPGFADQVRMALPEHISVEKFQRTVITAVAKAPDLLGADRQTLFTSCVEAAADGLLPNGKEAALVVYNTKNRSTNQWEKKVQYIPMIGGIYKKARNSGEISYLAANIVYENDHFDYELGFEPSLEHKPMIGDRGAVRCVYAVAVMKDGTKDLEVMTVAEVEVVRAASKASSNGPWVSWWGEMARKTAVRRLAKRLPLSTDLERVINRMDAMYEFEEGKKASAAAMPRGAHSTANDQLAAFTAPAAQQIEHQEASETEPEADPPHEFDFTDTDGEVEDLTAEEFVARFAAALSAATDSPTLEGLWETNSMHLQALRDMGMTQEAKDLDDAFGLALDGLAINGQPAKTEPKGKAKAEPAGDLLDGQPTSWEIKASGPDDFAAKFAAKMERAPTADAVAKLAADNDGHLKALPDEMYRQCEDAIRGRLAAVEGEKG